MEQTLGARIAHNRKQLKLTQEQLAEKLGVTAQAVSKWENDQSCPDITILPKLAEIFGISTDALLGRADEEKVHVAEVVTDDKSNPSHQSGKKGFRFSYDSGRKGALCFAIFVCAVGLQLLAAKFWKLDIGFWSILWPTALICFGIFGLTSKFSFFNLGTLLFGTYFLLDNWNVLPFQLGGELVFPILIVLFGLSLLADALKKPKKSQFKVSAGDCGSKTKNHYDVQGEHFDYSASFGDAKQVISLPRLSGGNINTSFGDYTIDLSGVQSISPGCEIEANCSFGELKILVPKQYAVHPSNSAAFADISTEGEPSSKADGTILLNANASFGRIEIRYIP